MKSRIILFFLNNWFFPMCCIIFLSTWAIFSAQEGGYLWFLEISLLSEVFILFPVLYIACYRKASILRKSIRILFIIYIGLYIVKYEMPLNSQVFLPYIEWIKYLKWPVAILIELKLALLVWKTVFVKKRSMDEVIDQLSSTSSIPPWMARLAKMEATFWRWIWGGLKNIYAGKAP